MMIRLPFRFMNGPYGKRIFTLDTNRIKDFLDISEACVARLAKVFSPPNYFLRATQKKEKIDFRVLATEYHNLMSNGICKDKADVARHLGVSRAWITMVFKKAGPIIF